MDERVKMMFLERDYFILREGLQKLDDIIRNVETHYGKILGGEEIKRHLLNLLDNTAQRRYCERGPIEEETKGLELSDIVHAFEDYGV